MKTIYRNANLNNAKNTALRQMAEKDEADRQFEEWRKSYEMEKRKQEYAAADARNKSSITKKMEDDDSFREYARQLKQERRKKFAGIASAAMFRTTGRISEPVERY